MCEENFNAEIVANDAMNSALISFEDSKRLSEDYKEQQEVKDGDGE